MTLVWLQERLLNIKRKIRDSCVITAKACTLCQIDQKYGFFLLECMVLSLPNIKTKITLTLEIHVKTFKIVNCSV